MPSYIANRKKEKSHENRSDPRTGHRNPGQLHVSICRNRRDKRDDATTVATSTRQQDGCPESAGHGKKQQKAKTQRDDQKEKELDRLLMGMYG